MSRPIVFFTKNPATGETDHELCRALLLWASSDHATNFKKLLSRATGVDPSEWRVLLSHKPKDL